MPENADRSLRYLIPIAGPPLEAYTLVADHSPLLLGRQDQCPLLTPADEERVSRYHALFEYEAGRWLLTDQKSTWGTFLNGYRLPPSKQYLLSEGDLIRITPWTFSFRSNPAGEHSIRPHNDLKQAMTLVRSAVRRRSARDPIALLMEAAAGVHQADSEQSLAQLVVDFAHRGTDYSNVAYLRPFGSGGRVEIVASYPAGEQGDYSRSLLEAASQGEPVVLGSSQSTSQSIVQLKISAALCVPLMLGGAAAGYLYLDNRKNPDGEDAHPEGHDFCLAMARVASLALANIKRVEIERRQASLVSQIAQAAAIQQYILPPRQQRIGELIITGQSRPGQSIGGDFFDVIALRDGRIALTLGDVSGKGVAASVLMTTIQGFLHALLETETPLDSAVMRLNAFLEHRKPEERFATLFAAIIDTNSQTVTYLDAAHGYGLLWTGESLRPLTDGGGPPVGAFTGIQDTAATVPFRPGDSLLVVSDGIVEQPQANSPDRQQFEIGGILQAMLQSRQQGADELATLFSAVEGHAGQSALSDDATALLVKWAS